MEFHNAEEAFEYLYDYILENGKTLNNTKFIQNIGFYIENPLHNKIRTDFRNWKNSYADLEWDWYLSKNRNVSEIKKQAKIWDKMHNGDNLVNSNYGYQWSRNNQLEFVIDELTKNPDSRRAVLTIYDGKDHELHSFDTPCTLNIVFNITNRGLNMSVLMRSNDLWFGFCNDQYCFSKLQEMVAEKLCLKVGWYYHFANNLHLYDKHFDSLENYQDTFVVKK
jgi:thymidylate synthase